MNSIALAYAAVPRIPCKGKCQASCGPIAAGPVESERFERSTGKRFPDALKILNRAISKGGAPECPLLNPMGQCDVYQHRPLICRLWGTVRAMACPFGCVPERWLSDAEAHSLMDQVEGIR